MRNHREAIRLAEADRLKELEQIIGDAQKSPAEVGLALKEIFDLKLFKPFFKSYEAYCLKKWGWTRYQGMQRMAGKVAKATAPTASANGKTMRLKLAEIVTDAGTQIRAALDSETVAEYASAMLDGAKFPPAVVFHNGELYILADGFHRVAAAVRNGFTDFAFDVRSGSKPEALKFALSANAQHGLKRTNADKRRSVELALTEWPHLADAELARMCAVGDDMVKSTRTAMENNLRIPKVETRIGHDGRQRKLPPVPIRPSTAPQVAQSDDSTSPPAATSSPVVASPLPPPPAQVVDATGWPVPTQLIPLWRRGDEAQELLTILSRVKGALRTAQDTRDKLFAEVNFSSALSQLDQAWADVKTAKPFAVCPSCQGQLPDQCTLCRGRGLISEHRWDTCVTREDKAFRTKVRSNGKAK